MPHRFVLFRRLTDPTRRPGLLFPGILLAAGLLACGAAAQGEGEKSGFVRFLEGLLSAPERQVSLSEVQGIFSGHPKIGRIEVADRDGVWLELEGVEVAWTRSALLKRRLDVQVLRAGRVAVLRRPHAGEAQADGGGLSAPPIEIKVDSVSLPQIVLGKALAGVDAELSAAGAVRMTAATTNVQLVVERQDRAGSLSADLRYASAERTLAADLSLEEPSGGLLSEALQLRGRPALAITVSGSGPLAAWQANLEMQADKVRVASGAMSITRADAGYRLRAKVAAALQTLVPEAYAALVAGDSGIDLDVTRNDDGTIAVSAAKLQSEGLSLIANGTLGADFVPVRAEASLDLGRAGRTTLPFLPGAVSLAGLRAEASLGGEAPAPWRINLQAKDARGDFGSLATLDMQASGEADRLADPEARATTFRVHGAAGGLALADARLKDAVGASAILDGSGQWSAGQPANVEKLALVLGDAAVGFSGTAAREAISGAFTVSADALSRFADLAGRPDLAGRARIEATGRVGADATFDLKLDGETGDLALGSPLDGLLKGATQIAGGVVRTAEGFAIDGLKLTNAQSRLEATGSLAGETLDLKAQADVTDLALVTPRAKGSVHIDAAVSGTTSAPQVEAAIAGDDVRLMDRPLSDATARFSGIVAGPQTGGEAEIAAMLGDAPVRGSVKLSAAADGTRQLEGLALSVGESRAAGDLAILPSGLLAGKLSLVSPDLSRVAPLFLVDAGGMLRGEVSLSADAGSQSAVFSGTATDIAYETVTLKSADLKGTAHDLFRAPQIEGSFSVRDLKAGGLAVVQATGEATRSGNSTSVSVDARLADGSARLQAALAPNGNGLAIGLDSFSYARPGVDLALARPTTIAVENGTARLDGMTFRTGAGSIAVSGRAGADLDLSAVLTSVPAALANAFVPNLGAEGTVSGTAAARGKAASPNAQFSLTLANVSVTASRNAGVGALSVTADGDLQNNSLDLRSRISGADGLAIDVTGKIGTGAGAPLGLRIVGSAPLSLGNAQLASRGAALNGTVRLDVAVTGTAAKPQFSGRATTEGGAFVDPQSGVSLRNLQLVANFTGDRVVVERLSATSGEGSVSGSGSIGLDPNAGFPVDIALKVDNARYVDGSVVATQFDADLKLTGTFAAGPLLEGKVQLARTEITVPERLPGDSIAVDVRHVDPPQPVERTLHAVRQPDRRSSAGAAGAGPGGTRLDVTVDAPQRIFVRGRGLDAEFGGRLRLSGTMPALIASGGFEMNRGRVDILTKRITFDRGVITFAGDLDPMLDFSGTTRSSDVAITVSISGRASDPQVTFSSTPDLPQDEILARLIFQKGIGELSPLQVARLAAAVSELAGGSGGVLGSLRRSTGLDDLDLVTDEEGDTSLAAGRYVTENVYLGVQQGTSAQSSRVTIDLDVTKNLKARAGMGAGGESSLGIFFEKEY